MIRISTKSISHGGWTSLVAEFEGHNLLQSWEYGAARAETSAWRIERCVFRDGDSMVAVAQVMFRLLPVLGGGLAWINRGPLWRRTGAETSSDTLVAVLGALRDHYAVKRGLYLRIAPPVVEGDAAVSRFAEAGFHDTGTHGWASAMLELAIGDTALRAGLHQKWRNALNKAERSNIVLECGSRGAVFEGFLAEYRDFFAARGFSTTVTAELIAALQRRLPDGRKMTVHRAARDGISLGSALIARHGDCAEYLAGTLRPEGRSLGVGQLLLWRALIAARAAGCATFDLGGMDPDLTPPGIFHFKDGLGGTRYRLCGEIEAPPRSALARLVRWRTARARDSGQRACGRWVRATSWPVPGWRSANCAGA